MAWGDLTTEEQQQVSDWMNQLFRPTAGEFARVLYHLDLIKIAYQAGTDEAIAKLGTTDIIPNTSGLSGATDITKEDLLQVLSGFNTVLTTYNAEPLRELYIRLAGAMNVMGK